MGSLTQTGRELELTITPVSGEISADVLCLTEFDATEALSELFRYELTCISDEPTLVDRTKILGASATVRMATPPDSEFSVVAVSLKNNGFGCGIRQQTTPGDHHEYVLDVVPWLWMLGRRTNCRIFQNRTVLEILDDVFADHGAIVNRGNDSLTGTYEPREYCVQYRETDLAFVERLLADEGIHYYFEHGETEHKLILRDDSTAADEVPHRETVSYKPGFDASITGPVVGEIAWHERIRSSRLTLRDYNFERSGQNTEVSQAVKGDEEVAAHELYDYPGGYAVTPASSGGTDPDRALGLAVAETRFEHELAQAVLARGRSTCREFLPGYRFELDDYLHHPHTDLLLTAVVHSAKEDYGRLSRPFRYRNEFRAIPRETPYRPTSASRKPIVEGLQTATVTGPDGQIVHTDKYGRVQVRFHWDRGDRARDAEKHPDYYVQGEGTRDGSGDKLASCWLRVSMGRAGAGWGEVSLPHIGHEVLVDFLEGDPDRPIIVGRVYNEAHMPPTVVDGKSLSSDGNEVHTIFEDHVGNRIVFNAEPGDEHIHIESHGSAMRIGGGLAGGSTIETLQAEDAADDTDDRALAQRVTELETDVGDETDTTKGTLVDRVAELEMAQKYDFNWGAVTELTVGTKTDLVCGNTLEGRAGFQFDGFLGAAVQVFVGTAFDFTFASKLEVEVSTVMDFGLATRIGFTKGPDIKYGGDTLAVTSKEAMYLDSDEKITLIGADNNRSKMIMESTGMTLDVGSDTTERVYAGREWVLFGALYPFLITAAAGVASLVGGAGGAAGTYVHGSNNQAWREWAKGIGGGASGIAGIVAGAAGLIAPIFTAFKGLKEPTATDRTNYARLELKKKSDTAGSAKLTAFTVTPAIPAQLGVPALAAQPERSEEDTSITLDGVVTMESKNSDIALKCPKGDLKITAKSIQLAKTTLNDDGSVNTPDFQVLH
jgi:type VI secretion system secreted protein VgrG